MERWLAPRREKLGRLGRPAGKLLHTTSWVSPPCEPGSSGRYVLPLYGTSVAECCVIFLLGFVDAVHVVVLLRHRQEASRARKWANGGRKIPLHYGAIIRLHIRWYCCFKEGYSIYIGKASTLHCRRAKIIIIKYLVLVLAVKKIQLQPHNSHVRVHA